MLSFALFLVGCPADDTTCPEPVIVADTIEIPDGQNSTGVSLEIEDPFPGNGLEIVTELTADGGSFEDPFARETTFSCAFDVAGPVQVCAKVEYRVPAEEPGAPNASGDFGSSVQAIRAPHVRLNDPLECSETGCTTLICPDLKNACPQISELTIAPDTLEEGETATVRFVAEDPDANPDSLTTTLTPRWGSIDNPNASQATFTCDDEIGGVIEICGVASDGDPACDVQQCATVLCPGEPAENTCPSIASFTANPATVPLGETSTNVTIDVSDPDSFPQPLRTELRSDTGVFDDRFVTETEFLCGESGPVEMCVIATDGDRSCDQERCITVQCPSDIPANLCPMLFVLNAVPSQIDEGETTTLIQSRGQDTDFLPVPLKLTLRALWGSFENTDNIQQPGNVVAQDATYICEFPGPVEICVDATDGACEKTLCIEVECPSDLPPP